MKTSNRFLSILIFSIFIVSCSQTPQEEVLASVDMKVEGMVCAMGCAKYIEDQVAELEGVKLSTVDFQEGIAHFEFDANKTSPKDLEKFIDNIHDGQYKAEIIETPEVEEVKEDGNATKEDITEIEVFSRFQISFPKLISYFLKSLR